MIDQHILPHIEATLDLAPPAHSDCTHDDKGQWALIDWPFWTRR